MTESEDPKLSDDELRKLHTRTRVQAEHVGRIASEKDLQAYRAAYLELDAEMVKRGLQPIGEA